jgi:hypothetical protein
MDTVSASSLLVKCPNCGNRFTPEDAIAHDIRLQLEREFSQRLSESSKFLESKIRKQESEKYEQQLHHLEEDRKLKIKRLHELEDIALSLEQKEKEVDEKAGRLELEMKKRLLDREKIIHEQAEKTAFEKARLEVREREQKLERDRELLDVMTRKRIQEEAEKVRSEERMKSSELQKKLEDQNKLINEMKRKSEQGSMQTQGEVQEIAMEEYLKATFPGDAVEEISKGKRGGDCVHHVSDHYNHPCGKILYESKRTKHFSYDWIAKIKDDMRLAQADLAVIVTEVLPSGMIRFGEIEGIWVCTFLEFKALALLFRSNLIRIGEVMASQENKGDKMQLLYGYVTSNEFKQKLEAAFESFQEMQDDLIREKTVFTAHWAKREKKLFKAMENVVSLYGDVRGIAGGAVQEIKCLEIAEFNQ